MRHWLQVAIFILVLFSLGAFAEEENAFLFPEEQTVLTRPVDRACEYGKHAMENGDFAQAIEYFRSAKSMEMTDASAAANVRLLLIGALEKAQKYAEVEAEVNDFLLRHSTGVSTEQRNQLRLCAAKAQIHLNKLDDAMRHLHELATAKATPGIAHQALCYLAECYLKRQEWSKAIELLNERRNDYTTWNRERCEWQLVLARAQLMGEKFAEARLALQSLLSDGAITEEQDKLTMQLLLIQAFAGEDNIPDALKLFDEIVAQCPQQPDAKWQAMLNPLCDKIKDDQKHKIALYQLLQRVAVDDESRIASGKGLAECQYALGQKNDAQKTLSALLATPMDDKQHNEIAMRLADWKIEAGNYAAARDLYLPLTQDGVLLNGSRYRALFQLAKCYDALDEKTQALEYYVKAAQSADTPTNAIKAWRLAAQCADDLGDIDGAVANYRNAAAYADESLGVESLIDSAMLLWKNSKNAEGLAEINRFIQEASARGNSAKLLAARLQSANWQHVLAGSDPAKLKAAGEALLAVAQECENAPEEASKAYLEACEIARKRGDIASAVVIIDEFIRRPPPAEYLPRAQRLHVLLLFRKGDTQAALTAADRYFKDKFGTDEQYCEIAMLCGDALAAGGKEFYSAAIKCYAKIPKESKFAPQARFEEALLNNLNGDRSTAEEILNTLRADEKLPSEMQVRVEMLQGDIAAEQGNFAGAIEYLKNAVQDSAGTQWQYVARGRLAELQMTAGSSQDALATLASCKEEFGKLSLDMQQRIVELLALCNENIGAFNDAIRYYQDLCVQYETACEKGIAVSSHYYTRAVWRLAELQTRSNSAKDLREIIHLLENYSKHETLPRASEAASLAKELSKKL